MAKVNLQCQLKRNDGSPIGSSISSGDKLSKTEALDAIANVIQQRVDAANGSAAELVEAQNAFNS